MSFDAYICFLQKYDALCLFLLENILVFVKVKRFLFTKHYNKIILLLFNGAERQPTPNRKQRVLAHFAEVRGRKSLRCRIKSPFAKGDLGGM